MSSGTLATARAERDAFVADAHARAVRTATRTLTTDQVVFGIGFWAVYAVVVVAVPLIVRAADGVMGGGPMMGAAYAFRWFAFSLAIIVFLVVATTHVAAGGTRRSLFDGVLRATVVVSVLHGLCYVALLLGERALVGGFGWDWDSPVGGALDAGRLAVVLVTQVLAAATFVLVGVCLAVGYQSHGIWWATLRIVPGLLLLFLAEVGAGNGSGHDVAQNAIPLEGVGPTALGVAAGVLAPVLAALWTYRSLGTLRLSQTR